jgi:hypothetical protein
MDDELLAAVRAIVDPGRIRLAGLLAVRPADAVTLAAGVRRPLPAVRRDLELLEAAGVVERRTAATGEGAADVFVLRPDRIGGYAAALASLDRDRAGLGGVERGAAWPHDGESLAATLDRLAFGPDERKVLRGYLVDGRLETIPAKGRKRDVILRFLRERVFTEDRDYPEPEVNQRLALFHPDVAALRRYLVDEGMVTREAGRYRRAGNGPGPGGA